MFFILSKILDVALSPLTWAVFLIALGFGGREAPSKRRRWFIAAGLGVLLLFSLDPVANAIERLLESSAKRSMRTGETYDAVILLGGLFDEPATRANDVPAYNDSVERLLVTYDLLRTGRARYAIVSGGRLTGSSIEIPESRALAEQLAAWGIARGRIVEEDQARNTHENAVYSARIVRARGWQRVVMVTSAFHVARALGCFRAEQLAVDVMPVDYRAHALNEARWIPRADELSLSTRALRELFGRWIYSLRGYSR